MFARMTILQVKLESVAEAIKRFRTVVVPEAKKQRGYRGACLLVDRAAGKGIAVTFWRSEKDALANEKSLFYQEQLVKFMEFFSGPPIRGGYEVAVHSLGPSGRRGDRLPALRRPPGARNPRMKRAR
jgi:heme-degrading monooxygenase HmoA